MATCSRTFLLTSLPAYFLRVVFVRPFFSVALLSCIHGHARSAPYAGVLSYVCALEPHDRCQAAHHRRHETSADLPPLCFPATCTDVPRSPLHMHTHYQQHPYKRHHHLQLGPQGNKSATIEWRHLPLPLPLSRLRCRATGGIAASGGAAESMLPLTVPTHCSKLPYVSRSAVQIVMQGSHTRKVAVR